MALSRTLLRTHALQRSPRPSRVLHATNERLLADSQAEMFVTVFFGILDPASGTLTYGNAGHNPPYLLRAAGGEPTMLPATGAPLGYLDDVEWGEESVQLAPGDTLVSYTDGVTEAEDGQGGFFGQERLLELLQAHQGVAPAELERTVLGVVGDFRGACPQTDDITLIVIQREPGGA